MIKCIIILALLSSVFATQAQTIKELRLLSANCCDDGRNSEIPPYSVGDGILKGAFWFYKSFVSSQDSQSCVFTPSCSEYAVQAIESQGVVQGMLNTFDRLTRCHGLGAHKYRVDGSSNLLMDPVKDVRYEKP